MNERTGSNEIGLLPHEAAFVVKALSQAIEKRRKANLEYGEAVQNSGGDWAFDDPASQAAAQTAHIKDKSVQSLNELNRYIEQGNILEYPILSPVATYGSRVTILRGDSTETYDIYTRSIPGLSPPSDILPVSGSSTLGTAILDKSAGDEISWSSPDGKRTFSGRIVKIDQTAQMIEYGVGKADG